VAFPQLIAQKPVGPVKPHEGLPFWQVFVAFVQLIDASGATQLTRDMSVWHDGVPEHVIPQNSVALTSTPLSHDLLPAQFTMQTPASHVGGTALQDSAMHWMSQRPDSQRTPSLQLIEPVQRSVHELPPLHCTDSQLLVALQSIVQSLPGGQSNVVPVHEVPVHARVHVPPVHVPPAAVHAVGSHTFGIALSTELSVLPSPVLVSVLGPSTEPSPVGASPASEPVPPPMSSRSSIPRTAAHAATAITAPESTANRAARATTLA
jgi:hypothetical protein